MFRTKQICHRAIPGFKKSENIKYVCVKKSRNDSTHIVTWNQPRSKSTIVDIRRDDELERSEVRNDNKLYNNQVKSGCTYEYRARSGESAPECSSGPIDPGPLDPRHVKVEPSNGGVKFSCPKEEKSLIYAKIKDGKKTVCKKLMQGAQKMEFLDLKNAGVTPRVVNVFFYTINRSGKKSKAIKHRLHLDDILDVTLYVYYNPTRVFFSFILEGKNLEREEDLAKKRKNYRATNPEVYPLRMSPEDKFRGRLQCLNDTHANPFSPRRGHSVSYDEVLRQGCAERTFMLYSENVEQSHSTLKLLFFVAELTIPINIPFHDQECIRTRELSKPLDATDGDLHESLIPEGLSRSSNMRNNRVEDWQDTIGRRGSALDDLQNCDNFSYTSAYGTLPTSDIIDPRQTLSSEPCIRLAIFGNSRYIMAVFYMDNNTTAEDVYNKYTGDGFWQIGSSQKIELRSKVNIEARLFGPIEPSYHNLRPEDLFVGPINQQFTYKRDSRETTARYEFKQMGNQLLNFSFFIGEHGGGPRNETRNKAAVVNIHGHPPERVVVNANGASASANQTNASQ